VNLKWFPVLVGLPAVGLYHSFLKRKLSSEDSVMSFCT